MPFYNGKWHHSGKNRAHKINGSITALAIASDCIIGLMCQNDQKQKLKSININIPVLTGHPD